MHYINLAFGTLLASAAASAIPVNNGVSALGKRQSQKEVYKSENGGSYSLSFSKSSVNLGIRNPGDIIGLLNNACGDTICETMDLAKDTKVYTADTHLDYNIQVTPGGDYKNQDKDALFKMLEAAAWKAMKCETVSYRPIFQCPMTPQPGFCPTPEAEEYIICEAPKFWSVQTLDNSGKLFVQISSEQDNSAVDWCESLMETAGGIADAANEAAGLGVSVASIGCKLT